MPAAQLFAIWAVAEAAVVKARLMTPRGPGPATAPVSPPVIAICDCEPAVFATNSATSGEPAMRAILAEARRMSPFWLGVHVPREANRDADLLSHPQNLNLLMAAAFALGFRPRHARVPKQCWDTLRSALNIGAAARKDKEARRQLPAGPGGRRAQRPRTGPACLRTAPSGTGLGPRP